MKYRTFGRTGLRVSAISLGTVELGMDYGMSRQPDEASAASLLNVALDLGVNYIDTARAYGEAEAIIGRALAGRRSEFVLATKAVPARIAGSMEESLRLLRTDAVDILLTHCGANEFLNDDSIAALVDVRERGLCRFIGASVYGPEPALAAIRSGVIDCLQIAYNPIDRRPETAVLTEAARAGVGIVARSVLLRGAITHRYKSLPDAVSELRGRIAMLDEAAEGNLPRLAYRYVLGSDPPQSALVGTGDVSELHEAIHYADEGPLEPDVSRNIRAIPATAEWLLNPGNWPTA